MRYVAIACAALMVATPAYSGDEFNGSKLYRLCTSSPASIEYTFCSGYAFGFLYGYISAEINASPNNTSLCKFRSGIDVTQAHLIVEKYMREHPEQLNKPADFVAELAFREVYGCKK
jgi:hypothetical protein